MVGRRRLSSLRHSLARVSSTAGGMVWRCGYSKASTVFRNFGTGLLYLRVIILLYPSLGLPDLKKKYTSNTFQHYCSYCICRSYQAGPCRGDISSLLRGDVSPSPKGQIGNATKPPFSILHVRFDNFSPFTHSLFFLHSTSSCFSYHSDTARINNAHKSFQLKPQNATNNVAFRRSRLADPPRPLRLPLHSHRFPRCLQLVIPQAKSCKSRISRALVPAAPATQYLPHTATPRGPQSPRQLPKSRATTPRD